MNQEYPEQPEISDAVAQEASAKQKMHEILGEDRTTFAEIMLADTSIPEEIIKDLPVFTHKELALTNISTEEQMNRCRLQVRNAINDYHLYTPHYNQTADRERKLGQLVFKSYIKLLRSTGGTDRERVQYNAIYSSTEKQGDPQQSAGFLGRIKRMIV